MKKVCKRCTKDFVCREDRRDLCRCSRVGLSPEMKNFVEDNYECLCPDCLAEIKTSFASSGINPIYEKKLNN